MKEPVKVVPRKRVRVNRAQFSPKHVKSEPGLEDLPAAVALDIKAEESDPKIDEPLPRGSPPEPRPSGPRNWALFVEKVREMRALREAPVDTMGCERVGANGGPLDAKTVRFQHLVALMLSSQTKDQVTAGAVTRLREQLKPTLAPESIVATPESTLEKLIFPVGFFRRKAQYLRQTAQILLDKYDGDIPQNIKEITALPGVGPKMGYLLLQAAWDQVDGIGVDVHVHRLAQLWRWVPKAKTPTPETTRLELEKWLPKDLWAEINPLLVGFGQTWCPPRSSVKTCQNCHLFELCPGAKRR